MKNRILASLALALVALSLSAQTKTPIPFVQNQWFKSNGTVAAGYKLCTYAAGTTTPATTYSTATGTSNTNPVTLDSAGRANVFLDASAYKFILYASGTGNTCNGQNVGAAVWTEDNIAGYSISYLPASPLGLAYGGTANTTGVRSDQTFGASGNPTCTVLGTNSGLNAGGGAFAVSFATTIPYVASTASTASNLQASISGAVVPASETALFYLAKNNVATALTCSVAAGASACSDTTHTVSIAAGDVITMVLGCSGGVTAITGSVGSSIRLSQ